MKHWDAFSTWLQEPEQGYKAPMRMDANRYVALYQRACGWSLIIGEIGDRYGFNEEYSFRNDAEAVIALTEWGLRDFSGKPQGWVRHTAVGQPDERRAEFTCTTCGGTYVTDWSEEDAVAEARRMYGDAVADNIDQFCKPICEDCFQSFQKWRAGLTPEEERRMQDEGVAEVEAYEAKKKRETN